MRKDPVIPDMEPTTDQSKDTNVVQLSETMSFITVIYRIKMAQGHLSLSPDFTQTCVTVYESWKHGAHCTICRQLNMLKSVLFL